MLASRSQIIVAAMLVVGTMLLLTHNQERQKFLITELRFDYSASRTSDSKPNCEKLYISKQEIAALGAHRQQVTAALQRFQGFDWDYYPQDPRDQSYGYYFVRSTEGNVLITVEDDRIASIVP